MSKSIHESCGFSRDFCCGDLFIKNARRQSNRCCRSFINKAIASARIMSSTLPSEGMVARFLTNMAPKYFKRLYLTEAARTATGKESVYVMTPYGKVGLKGKIEVAELDDPSKSGYFFCEGEGKGSMVDLVRQTCNPPTQFPNTAAGVWLLSPKKPRGQGNNRKRTKALR